MTVAQAAEQLLEILQNRQDRGEELGKKLLQTFLICMKT